jgi:hypothetical protein
VSAHETERLSAYLDGELPAAERAALEAHLAACDACAARLSALAEADRLAARQPLPEPPPGYFDAFPGRVRSRLEAAPARRPLRLAAWTWAAAAALLVAVLAPLVLERAPAPGVSRALPQETAAGPRAPSASDTGALPPAQPQARSSGAAGDAAPRAVPPPAPQPPGGGEPGPAAAQNAAPPRPPDAAAQAKPEAVFAREPESGGRAAAAYRQESSAAEADASGAARSEERSAAAVADAATGERAAAPRKRARREQAQPEPLRPSLMAEASRAPAAAPATAERRPVEEWRRLREEWRARAEASADPAAADEARVRAVEAAYEAWRADGAPGTEAVFRRDLAEYLARPDARQKERVRPLGRARP